MPGRNTKSIHKNPKINKKVNEDGNPVYYTSIYSETFIFIFMILVLPVIMAVMLVNIAGVEFNKALAETFVPIGLFIIFFLIFHFIFYGLVPKANRIEVSDNSLICKFLFKKKIEIFYNQFVEIECRRRYGRNHQYRGTKYYIVYDESNRLKKSKICFPSGSALDISDFNYEIQKRSRLGRDLDGVDLLNESRQFVIPQPKGINLDKMRYLVIFPAITFVFIMFIYGMMASKTGISNSEIPYVFMFYAFLIVFVVLASLKLNKNKWKTNPQIINIDRDGIGVDDRYFRSSEINRIYITSIGTDNPRAFGNSTIDIITDDSRYSYSLGLLYSVPMENWPYDDFYYCIKNWCELNKVEMVDFLI